MIYKFKILLVLFLLINKKIMIHVNHRLLFYKRELKDDVMY
jgi:hypothetical protein